MGAVKASASLHLLLFGLGIDARIYYGENLI